REFGVEFLELWIPENVTLESLPMVLKLLNGAGVRTACVSSPSNLNYTDDIKGCQELIINSIRAAEELGANVINTYFGPSRKRDCATAIEEFARNIRPCLDEAERRKITICLENEFIWVAEPEDAYGKEPTTTAEGALEVVNRIGSQYFRLNFDGCNFYVAGEEPYPYAYTLLKEYIEYIHLKDATKYFREVHGEKENHRIQPTISVDYVPVPLGQGAINYGTFVEKVASDGYDGFLTLEPHVPRNVLEPTIEESLNFLRSRRVF
ncbi:MAG: sugar phosphate isomerase/epimerase family protein, partial [Spirochaetota bacterium]